jgi:hypothetical protein
MIPHAIELVNSLEPRHRPNGTKLVLCQTLRFGVVVNHQGNGTSIMSLAPHRLKRLLP